MKNIVLIVSVFILIVSCKSTNNSSSTIQKAKAQVGDTLTISSDKLEYDIIIIEPGFNTWLASRAQPKNYYSQNYLENKNQRYVIEWNTRVLRPQRYNPNLYEMQIDYQPNIDYGYDVNYKLYNYFIFFQNQYNQNLLGGVVPTN
ncbi:DUF6146 family protein [Lacinutrix sp. 5H-3-7-4]|uniref:DUF6146 family protein n=1 Tax=Lacinutrix sp. (strain 5H-3-7-4) TaxID=983544 RepID=UPI00020A369F|nr:DUF6146 family protein [Lacinutrix sp. 5H-3-7-4]AEH02233.1 hypothetical protein Lacal_2391 [Lacinutrix sp. 5H-3-7-4]